MTIVVLVRHGRTAANRRGILAGQLPGMPLDGTGRRQAASLGTRLRRLPLDVVVHSPLERCAQTAQAIAAARPSDPPTLVADDRLVECDYGRWSGQSLAALAQDPLWPRIQSDPGSVRFPDGEAMSDMAARAVAALADWAGRHPDGVVALVSHGDLIKAMLSHSLAQPFAQFQRIVVSPGSVSVVSVGADHTAVLGMNLRGGALPWAGAAPVVGGGAT